ncbi:MAG: S-layer homology domain-containing protein [Tepidanaerobacteraceae bacterium]|jgi:prenyltransferase beta subunit
MYSKSQAKKVIAVTLMVFLVCQFSYCTFAAEKTTIGQQEISDAIDEIVKYICKNNEGCELTEWQIIGMTAAGIEVPEKCYENLEEYVKAQEGNFRKITDYAKIVMAVTALNSDPRNVSGYDIIEKIYNNDNMTLQGTNGPIFALIALDASGCSIPQGALWSREKLLDYILNQQNADGGFPLTYGEASDIDITAMTLQTLSRYQENPGVITAIENAVDFLSQKQSDDGGYTAWGDVSSESISQTIIALTALEIDPAEDFRFVKDGNLISKLFSFKEADGGFSHIQGEGSNDMATEQALVALAAYKRFLDGKSWIYDMQKENETFPDEETFSDDDVSFADINSASEWAREYIEKTKKYGLMEGKGDNLFEPKQNLTRAEFTTLLGRLLNFEPSSKAPQVFTDVKPDSWYYGYVMKAYKEGIISGKFEEKFMPNDYITREEMAVMFHRALSLKASEDVVVKDIQEASQWAVPAIKVVVENQIMIGDNGVFLPKQKVTREMAATVIVRVFEK